jgi:hypothetical protein
MLCGFLSRSKGKRRIIMDKNISILCARSLCFHTKADNVVLIFLYVYFHDHLKKHFLQQPVFAFFLHQMHLVIYRPIE